MKEINFSETLKKIGTGAAKGFAMLSPFIGYALLHYGDRIAENVQYSGDCGYGDAVNAISSSGMTSLCKQNAISVLKKDGDSEFYKAVISIAKSNMTSLCKEEAISNMCKKTE